MNYDKIYTDKYSETLELINEKFKVFLKEELQSNYKEYSSNDRIFPDRLDVKFYSITSNHIDPKFFEDTWRKFEHARKEFTNVPIGISTIDVAVEKAVIPIYNKKEYSFGLKELIEGFAELNAYYYAKKQINLNGGPIKTNFDQNQIDKINIYKKKSSKTVNTPIILSFDLEIEERLFLHFLTKKIESNIFNKLSVSEFHTVLDCKITEYARITALSIGFIEESLFEGNHSTSIVYKYIFNDRYDKHTNDKKFLSSLLKKISELLIPKNVISEIDIMIHNINKSSKK